MKTETITIIAIILVAMIGAILITLIVGPTFFGLQMLLCGLWGVLVGMVSKTKPVREFLSNFGKDSKISG